MTETEVYPAPPVPEPTRDDLAFDLPSSPPSSMEDFERLPPEVQEHMRLVATPAHVAMAVTADASPEVKWTPAPHLMHINERVVQACMSPDQSFLDVEVPVRHGKSFLLSGYLPFWYLGWFPDRRVILLSYNEDRAATWGEFTRELMALWGPSLFGQTVDPKTASRTRWSMKGRRGEVIATGLAGTITGVGGDLVVIDDPIKNRKDADSPVERRALVEGYASNVRTRLEGQGTVVLAMARWREDDLAGTVVHGYGQEEGEIEEIVGDEPDHWEVIHLPAIAEAPNPPEHVKHTRKWRQRWRDELGRKDGEALWDEKWPIDKLKRLRATYMRTDPQTWDSLYQQRPTGKTGNEFQTDKWRKVPQASVDLSALRLVRWWDLAATADGGDWTVGALVGMDSQGDLFIIDVVRKRLATHEVEALVESTARVDGTSVPIRIEQERAGAGKAVVAGYVRRLAGFDVEGERPEHSKEDRASPYAAHQQRGRCWMVEADWNAEWIEEHRVFPKGTHDDMVDCGSGAFEFLVDLGPSVMETQHQMDTPLALLYQQRSQPAAVGRGAIEARRAALLRR